MGSLAALNDALAAADARDDARRIGARAESVGAAAALELILLHPLPGEVFDVAATLSCRVDAKARVCVRQSYYSVPARYAGRRVEVRLGADTIRVLDPSSAGTVVAVHARSLHKGSEDLVLGHYLEVLTRKPGAMAARRRWSVLARVEHLLPLINGSGPQRAPSSVTSPEPGRWSGCCSCTAPCPRALSPRVSRPRWR